MVFHRSLRDSKFPQVSRTLLSIPADLKTVVAWMVSTCPTIFKAFSLYIYIYIYIYIYMYIYVYIFLCKDKFFFSFCLYIEWFFYLRMLTFDILLIPNYLYINSRWHWVLKLDTPTPWVSSLDHIIIIIIYIYIYIYIYNFVKRLYIYIYIYM